MAWAERLPSGKYRGCWRTPDGRQHHTRRPDFPEHPYARKRDAVEAAQEAEVKARRQAAANKGTISASVTWGEWWDHLEVEHQHTDVSGVVDSSVRLYLRPRWGTEPLNRIKQRDVKAWVADLLPGREVSYVHRIYAVFRWSINQAVDRGVLDASPCSGVKLPAVRRKAKPYTDEAFVDALRPHLPKWYQDLIDLGRETGLRPGELCGLHADTCDLDDGWLTVSKVLVAKQRVIRPFPKDKDERRVPLTDKAISIIRRNLAGRDLAGGCGLRHTDGKPCRSVLVIRNSRGQVITPMVWRNRMVDAAKRAKIDRRGRTPYGARRAFFTRAARGGVDVFDLALYGGHANLKQTQEYVQETPGARDRLRAALGETTRLTVVQGQAGAEPGADPDNHAPRTGTHDHERRVD